LRRYETRFQELCETGAIVRSTASFKKPLFLAKAKQSFLLARHLHHDAAEPQQLSWYSWAIVIHYYAMLYAAKAAILTRGYEVKSHEAALVALAGLLVPTPLEREDLELLDQAQRIFEEEYLSSFAQAQTESYVARYAAIKRYTERQVAEIEEDARRFLLKIEHVLE